MYAATKPYGCAHTRIQKSLTFFISPKIYEKVFLTFSPQDEGFVESILCLSLEGTRAICWKHMGHFAPRVAPKKG